MRRIYTCLAEEHDPVLLLAAALLCLIGATVSLGLLHRARRARPEARAGWLLLGGLAVGASIWCTHFVAMLGYQPGFGLGFRLLPTLGSLLLAVVSGTAALAVAAGPWALAAPLGGALFGLGTWAMHLLGLSAYGDAGVLRFSPLLLGASLLFGMALGALALMGKRARPGPAGWFGGGVLLAASVLSLHVTGMAAIRLLPLPLQDPDSAESSLGLAVVSVALMVFAAALAALLIDRRAEEEGEQRLRRLADAAMEGLAVVQEGRIVEANHSFQALCGRTRAALLGQPLPGALLEMAEAGEAGWLRHADGSRIEVALQLREGLPEPGFRVFVLRDLRPQRAQEARLDHMARHDALTGLPNRARFAEMLEQALAEARGRHGLALLRLGLNGLKTVNGLHGHAAGDAALRAYARALAARLPEAGLARLGGDEFAALLPFRDEAELQERLPRIAALTVPVGGKAGAGPLGTGIGAAIGAALYPEDAGEAEALMAYADIALQRAKALPGRPPCFHDAAQDARLQQRRRLAQDLAGALAEGQFFLVFQPQMVLASGQLCGHEALLRWHHPQLGLVPPDHFIPLAEESGLILPLGAWTLRQACAAAAAEPRLGKVAVNLSPLQFRDEGLPALVAATLAETGLPPQRLELEITESAMMQEMARALEMLRQLQGLGIGIAMDDFGTGYSSLGTLRAFPFHKIKLDRSFMREIGESPAALAILRAVLDMGQGLGVPVLAEGVETPAQRDRLREEGCAEAQGYLFGRPLPLAELFPSPTPAAA
ncbi:EAL domain-containing protein [Pseudoroseomonas cervicalis]|uniref:bifunctional diguanylate cyclase/phosphodiesterase n=1 Tax=Teichococcus cervicalis TaxID=204525 RepID=UPI00277F1AE3|nr:EAL domain-containing protein [Pseudoroseomonas cervicalis]MDQ1080407.1 diguanylate cyclase (GGDEF)-like protein [Pseudoroseomonas cervicalis]